MGAGHANPDAAAIDRAMRKLKSHHEGDQGLLEIVDLGPAAIPALKDYVFAREPSGLYEARRRGVIALEILHAENVLIDFLRLDRQIDDPAERTGEDAIINAAARGLMKSQDPAVFPLLQDIAARRPSLAGIIEALGSFRRVAALPQLIAAMFEDFSRGAAEDAIRGLGKSAIPALFDVIAHPVPTAAQESVSSLRRRRSALMLLSELPLDANAVRRIAPLIDDKDARLAVYASRIVLAQVPGPERRRAIRRLVDVLPGAEEPVAADIVESLRAHLDDARGPLTEARRAWAARGADTPERYVALRRLDGLLQASPARPF
jgi:hypothetical protein